MSIKHVPCPDWERLGFSREPDTHMASGLVVVFRSFSAFPKRRIYSSDREIERVGSFLWGNCLFMPRGVSSEQAMHNAVTRQYKQMWTGIYLERQLNAWVWGNEFERVAAFTMAVNTKYWRGPVGMDTLAYAPYRDRDTGVMVPTQRHSATPLPGPPDLLQVVVLGDDDQPIRGKEGLKRVLNLRTWWEVVDPIKWGSTVMQ